MHISDLTTLDINGLTYTFTHLWGAWAYCARYFVSLITDKHGATIYNLAHPAYGARSAPQAALPAAHKLAVLAKLHEVFPPTRKCKLVGLDRVTSLDGQSTNGYVNANTVFVLTDGPALHITPAVSAEQVIDLVTQLKGPLILFQSMHTQQEFIPEQLEKAITKAGLAMRGSRWRKAMVVHRASGSGINAVDNGMMKRAFRALRMPRIVSRRLAAAADDLLYARYPRLADFRQPTGRIYNGGNFYFCRDIRSAFGAMEELGLAKEYMALPTVQSHTARYYPLALAIHCMAAHRAIDAKRYPADEIDHYAQLIAVWKRMLTYCGGDTNVIEVIDQGTPAVGCSGTVSSANAGPSAETGGQTT